MDPWYCLDSCRQPFCTIWSCTLSWRWWWTESPHQPHSRHGLSHPFARWSSCRCWDPILCPTCSFANSHRACWSQWRACPLPLVTSQHLYLSLLSECLCTTPDPHWPLVSSYAAYNSVWSYPWCPHPLTGQEYLSIPETTRLVSLELKSLVGWEFWLGLWFFLFCLWTSNCCSESLGRSACISFRLHRFPVSSLGYSENQFQQLAQYCFGWHSRSKFGKPHIWNYPN